MTPVQSMEAVELVPNGWGGNRPLPVARLEIDGQQIEATAWVPTDAERKMISEPGALINLVMARAPDGTLSFSMRVVVATLVPDNEFN